MLAMVNATSFLIQNRKNRKKFAFQDITVIGKDIVLVGTKDHETMTFH